MDGTEADQLDFIRKDLANELRWLCRGAVTWSASLSRSAVVQRVQAMDSTYLHARALYDYFFGGKSRGDDARAVHIAPGWELEPPSLLESFLGAGRPANKRLFHMVYGRSNQHGGRAADDDSEHLKNRVVEVANELLVVTRMFASQLDDPYRSAVERVLQDEFAGAVALAKRLRITPCLQEP